MIREQRLDQQARLGRASAAEFDKAWGDVEELGDLIAVLLQNAPLGSGRVVLGQLTDLLEELRATAIVEEPAGQVLCTAAKPAPDFVAK